MLVNKECVNEYALEVNDKIGFILVLEESGMYNLFMYEPGLTCRFQWFTGGLRNSS